MQTARKSKSLKSVVGRLSPAMGPFRQIDTLGADRAFALSGAIYEATFHAVAYRPHPRLQRMVQAGLTGHNAARGGFRPDARTPSDGTT